MELLEIQNAAEVEDAFATLSPQWRFLPPVIMFMTTAKIFVFFFMDIVIITLIARAGWAAATYHMYVEDTIRQYSSNMSRANPAFEDSQVDILAQKQHNKQVEYMSDQSSIHEIAPRSAAAAQPETPIRYNDTSIQPFVYPERNFYSNGNHQDGRTHSIPRPTTLALSSKLNDRFSTQMHNGSENNFDTDREIENRLSHFTTSDGNVVRSVEPLKDEIISERQQQQTRVRVLPPVAEIKRNSSEIKQRPPVPPKPSNYRVSMQPSTDEDQMVERSDSRNSASKVDRTSSMKNELRGQLPWSYFKARDDVPKKAFNELDEDEDLPPVPIPDYTLHFPKNKRTNLSDSDGDGSWNKYDQRY